MEQGKQLSLFLSSSRAKKGNLLLFLFQQKENRKKSLLSFRLLFQRRKVKSKNQLKGQSKNQSKNQLKSQSKSQSKNQLRSQFKSQLRNQLKRLQYNLH